MLLFIACLALGVLLAWGLKERGRRAVLSARNHDIEDAYVAVLAKRGDLASFLTDPRTRLYRLSGRGVAGGRAVTVAWQEETRTGMLIGDRVPAAPDDRTYVMWHLDQKRDALSCGALRPDPGGTFYEFHLGAAGSAAADGTSGFVLSLETGGDARTPGAIAYETR
jgi:hypothetical protein